jgi:rhodanese-related sulfurtransferase
MHGTLIGLFVRRERKPAGSPTSEPGLPGAASERITIEEVRALRERGEPHVIIDARAPRSYSQDPRQPVGARRLPPADAVATARRLALDTRATLVVYCT